jgi:hypothetical protein
VTRLLFCLTCALKLLSCGVQAKNSVDFSPQTNYTDWVTATGRAILMRTSADRGVLRGQSGGSPTIVNFSFLYRSRYFLFQAAPHLSSWRWVDPVPDKMLLRKCGSAGNWTQDLWVSSQELWPLDHRGGHCEERISFFIFLSGLSGKRSAYNRIRKDSFILSAIHFWRDVTIRFWRRWWRHVRIELYIQYSMGTSLVML